VRVNIAGDGGARAWKGDSRCDVFSDGDVAPPAVHRGGGGTTDVGAREDAVRGDVAHGSMIRSVFVETQTWAGPMIIEDVGRDLFEEALRSRR
jgi:hypothetical protein